MGRQISIGPWVVLLMALAAGRAGHLAWGAEAGPRPGIAVWDTMTPADNRIAAETLAARVGWAQIATAETAAGFQGDAVMSNGRILAAVRKQATGVEIYALSTGGAVPRLRLMLLTAEGSPAARLSRVALVENTRAAACLEVSYQTAAATEVAARLRLKRGEIYLETEARAGTARSKLAGPVRIPVARYEYLGGGQLTRAVPQPETTQRLDVQGDKLMSRVVYRRIGDQEIILAAHSVKTAAGGGGARWYEFALDRERNVHLRQQGTYAPEGLYRWMPS